MPVPFRTVQEVIASILERDPSELNVFVVEFDELCRFNHLLGEDMDERILSKLYAKIKAYFGDNVSIDRIGTYRVAIFLFENVSIEAKAKGIIEILKEPLYIDEHLFYVTATVGAASRRNASESPYVMLKNA
jgi:GGDEF domain-containing protein